MEEFFADKEYPYLYNKFKQLIPELSHDQLTTAILVCISTCPHCWEVEATKCSCWNDE